MAQVNRCLIIRVHRDGFLVIAEGGYPGPDLLGERCRCNFVFHRIGPRGRHLLPTELF